MSSTGRSKASNQTLAKQASEYAILDPSIPGLAAGYRGAEPRSMPSSFGRALGAARQLGASTIAKVGKRRHRQPEVGERHPGALHDQDRGCREGLRTGYADDLGSGRLL